MHIPFLPSTSTSFRKIFFHPILRQPVLSLALTSLSLLLLVLVLLSVPGPIKGLYWFSVKGENGDEPLSAGVLGWCMIKTSNCTYAPLSDNAYLSTMINTGEALTVRLMLPLACYWMIVTLVFWVLLTILTPIGYAIKDLDSISRHLRFAVIEACVLCVSLFGNVLCWLALGLGRTAYMSVKDGGANPKSGHAMETSAVAALLSLLSLFTAVWGLHLRLRSAQSHWKEEAVMVRRRSMALSAAGAVRPDDAETLGVSVSSEKSNRWSQVPDYTAGTVAPGHIGQRGSMVKATYDPGEEEEQLEANPQEAKRNSLSHDMLRRASIVSINDTPYAAAHAAGPK